jgi:hypothetical protein
VLTYLLLQQEMLFFWFVLKAYNIFLLLKDLNSYASWLWNDIVLWLLWYGNVALKLRACLLTKNIFNFHSLKFVFILTENSVSSIESIFYHVY